MGRLLVLLVVMITLMGVAVGAMLLPLVRQRAAPAPLIVLVVVLVAPAILAEPQIAQLMAARVGGGVPRGGAKAAAPAAGRPIAAGGAVVAGGVNCNVWEVGEDY